MATAPDHLEEQHSHFDSQCTPGQDDACAWDQSASLLTRESHPGMPNSAEKITDDFIKHDSLQPGDHIVYRVTDLPYRPVFRSAMFLNISTGSENDQQYISLLINDEKGVRKIEAMLVQSLLEKSPHKIIYAPECRYSNEEAIQRAVCRLEMKENCFHALYNNSHFFVTLVKTGKEYPMTEIVESLMNQCDGVYYLGDDKLTPVIKTGIPLKHLEELELGNHIMIKSKHWLVGEVLTTENSFKAYGICHNHVVYETIKWTQDIVRLDYDAPFKSKEAIDKAQTEYTHPEQKWKTCAEFVTQMKCGVSYLFDICSPEPESCTRITPDVLIKEGDHLLLKNADTNYHSIIVYKCIDTVTFQAITGLDQSQIGVLNIEKYDEIHRVNYTKQLPNEEVLKRAISPQGCQLLQECLPDTSLFVTWAKTGTSTSLQSLINGLVQKQAIKQVQPETYTKLINQNEVKVGDHLFQQCIGYRWHFMVIEKNVDEFDPTMMKTVYCLWGKLLETIEQVDVGKRATYRIDYTEQLPVCKTITRAKSKLKTNALQSPYDRMGFIRWAKTGSNEGIEVDFLTNTSLPVSKSRIWTFSQLEPGDYLVKDPGKSSFDRHYIVKSVESPTRCTVIGRTFRYEKVNQSNLTINVLDNDKDEVKFYRMNYYPGVCILATQSLEKAEQLISTRLYIDSELINYVKTTDAQSSSPLQEDRILLRRVEVTSVKELMQGDHIECELDNPVYNAIPSKDMYHHMLVSSAIQDQAGSPETSLEVYEYSKSPVLKKYAVQKRTKNVSGYHLRRIIYPDRILPKKGIECLESRLGEQKYGLLGNNCEHLIAMATTDHRVSFQVDKALYSALMLGKHSVKVITPSSSARSGLKSITKASVKVAARTSLKATKTAASGAGKSVGKAVAKYSSAKLALSSFKLGYPAAVSGATMGALGGIALGVNVAIEAPLLAWNIYKLNRKKKFNMISQCEYKRGLIKESFTSVNTVIGGTAGVMVGQVAIPVPILGAAVGGVVGVIAGRLAGMGEGYAVSKLISDDKPVVSPIEQCQFTESTSLPSIQLNPKSKDIEPEHSDIKDSDPQDSDQEDSDPPELDPDNSDPENSDIEDWNPDPEHSDSDISLSDAMIPQT